MSDSAFSRCASAVCNGYLDCKTDDSISSHSGDSCSINYRLYRISEKKVTLDLFCTEWFVHQRDSYQITDPDVCSEERADVRIFRLDYKTEE